MHINLTSPINSLGYGYTGLHITDELIKMDHKVALFPIGNIECHVRHHENIKQAIKNAETFSTTCPCIRIWHQHDMSMFVGHGAHIGFPIFELDTFTSREKHHLNSCDGLFVCSDWAKGIIEKNSITRPELDRVWYDGFSQVVPLGVDTEIFTPKMSIRKPTIFLNCGKWEVRKGHKELIEAFNSAFKPSDNVELWLMCDNPFLKPEQTEYWTNMCRYSKLSSKIRILPRVESDIQVADIMKQADCGVFPARAEGWNLEALEMLSCGKQLIATDYSGHSEFLTEANSFLLPINSVESAFDGIWFHGQGNWGKLDKNTTDELINKMQLVHDRKQSGQLELNMAGIETAKNLTWRNTAETIVQHLEG